MDANQTRYQLLLGSGDWGACLLGGVSLPASAPPPLASLWASAGSTDSPTSPLAWDARRQQLRLASRLFEYRGNPAALDPDSRRGAAIDRYNNVYWIDPSTQTVQVNSSGTGTASEFWPGACTCGGQGVPEGGCPRCGPSIRRQNFQLVAAPPPATPPSYAGLTVTADHYLLVGVPNLPGLLVFDLFAGGPPFRLLWPRGVPFQPFDMAAAPCGGAWVLDRTAGALWALDRGLAVVDLPGTAAASAAVPLDPFQPVGGSPPRTLTPARTMRPLFLSTLTPPVADPVAVTVLPDGSVLVLDRCPGRPFSNIYRLVNGQQVGQPVGTGVFRDLVDPSDQSAFQLTGHAFAFVPTASLIATSTTCGAAATAAASVAAAVAAGSVLGTLTVAGSDGFQAFAFDVFIDNGQLTLDPQGDYLPMRDFGGMGLAASSTQAYYDSGPGWVPLVAQKRPRYVFGATLQTPAQRPQQPGAPAQGFFDGRDPGCVWHRVMLDASIPPGTSVTIWSRAADDPGDLPKTAWEQEPPLYLRDNGSELPFLPPPRPPGSGPAYNGTWELLLQHAVGRYLQLQIEVNGDGRDTPRLRALRAYYPRFSYLKHYLPGCYGDQPVPASFLERYLASVEGFYTALEDKITHVSMLLDSRSVPATAIDWLVSWFGVTANPNWSEANTRLFVKYAMTLFQYRGTIRGLRMALALVLDACPDEGLFMTPPQESQYAAKTRVVEGWQTRLTPAVVFGDPTGSTGLRQVPQAALWDPTQGGSGLSSRYAAALSLPQGTVYPIRDPGGTLSAGWQQFSSVTLGFVPSATDADQPTWSAYLRRRYASLAALNGEYGQSWTDFSTVPVPTVLPPDGAQLIDWFQFEGVVLPTRKTAHQFTVLLPVQQNAMFDINTQNQQLGLAQQLIASEKPAHTVFQVKFYYVLFQVGSARLGLDTSLEQGSRSPYLMPPMVLGSGFLSESYLTPQFPLPAPGRRVIGRGRLKAGGSSADSAGSAAPTSTLAAVWTGDRS